MLRPCNRDAARRCVTLNAPPALKAPALSGTATLCWILGRYDEATDLHRRALAAFRNAGNEQGAAWTTMCLAVQALDRDDSATAQRLSAEALSSPHASPRTRIGALTVLSLLAFYAGDKARALELRRESAELARPLGDRWLLGIVLTNLAECLEQIGDYVAAERLVLEAVCGALELGAQGGQVTNFLEQLADIYVQRHRIEPAVRVLAAADAYRTERGCPRSPGEQPHIESVITKARTEAGPIRFGLAWAGGQALTLAQVLHEVLQTQEESSQPEPAADQHIHSPSNQSAERAFSAAPW